MAGKTKDELLRMKADIKHLKHSTPIVVFAHIPLWSVYPEWGWGTEDSAQALAYLKKFGSVTVLNGHIHQTMQKVEGNVTFHNRGVDGISPTAARQGRFAGALEGAGGAVEELAGNYKCELRTGSARVGGRGFFARVKVN
jgi:3',5'-cyclic-AMP phosphodiesterase